MKTSNVLWVLFSDDLSAVLLNTFYINWSNHWNFRKLPPKGTALFKNKDYILLDRDNQKERENKELYISNEFDFENFNPRKLGGNAWGRRPGGPRCSRTLSRWSPGVADPLRWLSNSVSHAVGPDRPARDRPDAVKRTATIPSLFSCPQCSQSGGWESNPSGAEDREEGTTSRAYSCGHLPGELLAGILSRLCFRPRDLRPPPPRPPPRDLPRPSPDYHHGTCPPPRPPPRNLPRLPASTTIWWGRFPRGHREPIHRGVASRFPPVSSRLELNPPPAPLRKLLRKTTGDTRGMSILHFEWKWFKHQMIYFWAEINFLSVKFAAHQKKYRFGIQCNKMHLKKTV